ncbi:hybrid sensor histidine kinase/response regulator transcription factor [Ochrovirga pacifica]|uniref:hybrid sensor histidine kinase/response regulator transcription factor n=1 Tax=Ochrovirga pacifica TaxID=1042376 RepID=UPI000255837C|nr:hybrid sensor histidine kinase/response regulator transcription factor [Ochrovirga pacifica]
MKTNYSLLFCFLFLIFQTQAQKKELTNYKILNISNGLSHNGVTSIFKDAKGFVWIGTYDGLNKYDGFHIKQYKNTYQKDLLSSNRVRSIHQNKRGELLIGTDNGLTIHNLENEKFTKIKILGNGALVDEPSIIDILIHPTSNDVICATENNELLILDEHFKLLKRFNARQLGFPTKRKFILDGLALDQDHYLFATTYKLIQYNAKERTVKVYNHPEFINSSIIEKIDEQTLLIGSNNEGVRLVHYTFSNGNCNFNIRDKQLSGLRFSSSNIDVHGALWLGEFNKGVYKFKDLKKVAQGNFQEYDHYTDQTPKLRTSFLVDFDKQYTWVGSFDKGVHILDTQENPFHEVKVPQRRFLNPSILSDHVFSLGVSGDGYQVFDFRTLSFYRLNLPVEQEEKNRSTLIYKDSREDLWFTYTGEENRFLGRLKKEGNSVEKIKISEEYLGGLKDITEDQYGNIWAAFTDGVFRININSGTVIGVEDLRQNTTYKNIGAYSSFKCLFTDPKYQYMWIGDKVAGLIRIENKQNQSLQNTSIHNFLVQKNNPNTISSNFVSSILRLKNGQMWIGTEGGGICYVKESNKTPEFVPYTEKEGLSNNVVKSVLADEQGALWISTNNGLNKFDIASKTFRNFTKEDGLPFEDFYYSSRKLDNGMFVFVGNESFCYFHTKNIQNKEPLPRLEFSEFRLFNKLVKARDSINNRVLLNKHVSYLNQIELKHNENVFSIEATPLHYSNSKNHHIQYKMEPLHQEWVKLKDGQNIIEFNGLQPGDYLLKVKASNSLNQWTVPKELSITIQPPFWKSNFSYSLYVLFGFLIIYMVFSIFLKIQKLNHEIEIEQIEFDNLKDVNESKLRFFSNITHEIKTPITLISGPIDFVLSKLKKGENIDVQEKLTIVQRQAKRISQLIDQVHDFQKSDTQQLKMNYEVFNFDLFLRNLVIDFKFLSEKEGKILKISGDKNTNVLVNADKDKLEKIFNNILSNAFKYTQSDDEISIDYKINGTNLVLSFTDTGKGIDGEDLPHIFERFYQSKKMTEEYIGGSGIGLAFSKRLVEMHYGYINAESELGKGTTIHIILPILHQGEAESEELEKILELEKEFAKKETVLEPEKVDFSKIKVDTTFAEARIFYAEDNVEMRNFVSEILSNFFQVTTFSNGAECLEAMNTNWPDLVLSDVLMPEVNGFELCKNIKDNIKTSHIPVVLLTACVSNDEQIQGIEEGADAYIKKPFNSKRLITTIESLLKNRKQLRERFKSDFPLELEKKSESKKDIAFIEKLYDLMSENLDNKDLDMDNLAKHLYLNRTHFYQKVKALTNQTPFELLKDYRLQKAAEFLVREKMTVNEVFIATGFKSRSHFSKVFKDKYNVTPGQYTNKGLDNLMNNS